MLERIDLIRVVHLWDKRYVFKYGDEDDFIFVNLSDKFVEYISDGCDATHKDFNNFVYIPYDTKNMIDKIVKSLTKSLEKALVNTKIDFDETDEYNKLMIDIAENKLRTSDVNNIKIHLFLVDKNNEKHRFQYLFEFTNMRFNEVSHTVDRNGSPDCGSVRLDSVYFYAKLKIYSYFNDGVHDDTIIRSIICNRIMPKEIGLECSENDVILNKVTEYLGDQIHNLVYRDLIMS